VADFSYCQKPFLLLHFFALYLQFAVLADDQLEIRRGNNSLGDLVPWTQMSELNDSSGFYIHLRMYCPRGSHFTATYIWMRPSRVDGKLNLMLIKSADEGGYVAASVLLSVCLFVYLSVCRLDHSESCVWLLRKFSWVGTG